LHAFRTSAKVGSEKQKIQQIRQSLFAETAHHPGKLDIYFIFWTRTTHHRFDVRTNYRLIKYAL